jgi:hypothetical protein
MLLQALLSNEMTLEMAKQEFLVRYYWWAKDQITREVDQRFNLLEQLRQSGNPPSLRFLNYAKHFDAYNVKSAMIAMLKRRMADAADFANEPFNEEDNCLCNSYFDFMPPTEIAKPKNHITVVDRQRLRKALKQCLGPIFGGEMKQFGAGTWRYSTRVHSWIVGTTIDTGGSLHTLSYSHFIGTNDCPDLLTDAAISIQSWLGIAGGPTYWVNVDVDNMNVILNLLPEVGSRFLTAASVLLSGLNTEEPPRNR